MKTLENNQSNISGSYPILFHFLIGFIILSITTILNILVPNDFITFSFYQMKSVGDLYYFINPVVIFFVLLSEFIVSIEEKGTKFIKIPREYLHFGSSNSRIIIKFYIVLNFYIFGTSLGVIKLFSSLISLSFGFVLLFLSRLMKEKIYTEKEKIEE